MIMLILVHSQFMECGARLAMDVLMLNGCRTVELSTRLVDGTDIINCLGHCRLHHMEEFPLPKLEANRSVSK